MAERESIDLDCRFCLSAGLVVSAGVTGAVLWFALHRLPYVATGALIFLLGVALLWGVDRVCRRGARALPPAPLPAYVYRRRHASEAEAGTETLTAAESMPETVPGTLAKTPDPIMTHGPEEAQADAVSATEPNRSAPASSAAAGATSEKRPEAMEAARGGQPDDLTRIRGIGPRIAEQLHGLGIWHFDQIAGWGPDEVAWMDNHLEDFRGRVTRDDWVAQAKALAASGPGAGRPQ